MTAILWMLGPIWSGRVYAVFSGMACWLPSSGPGFSQTVSWTGSRVWLMVASRSARTTAMSVSPWSRAAKAVTVRSVS